MNTKKLCALVLALLPLTGCAAVPAGTGNTSGPTVPAPTEPAAVESAAHIRWSCGSWSDDGNLYYQDKNHVSTQLLTEAELPAGSYLVLGEDYICEAVTWLNYKAQVGAATRKDIARDSDKGRIVPIDMDWWNKYGACAFNISVREGSSKTLEDAMKEVKLMIPGNASFNYNWNDDGVLKILTVGNSFSYDLMDHVYKIAQQAGVENIVLGNLYYGGCRVDQHYDFWANKKGAYTYYTNTSGTWTSKPNATYEAAFEVTDWDYISFQQSAQVKQSAPELLEHLPDLIETAKSLCPTAKIIWHMPWANPHGNYGGSIERMYQDLCRTSRTLIEPMPDIQLVIPSGTAIENIRSSYIDPSILLSDGWHLSGDVGRYVVGLTLVKQLTGLSIDHVTWTPSERTAAIRDICIEAANNAVACPYAVTQSTYTTAP